MLVKKTLAGRRWTPSSEACQRVRLPAPTSLQTADVEDRDRRCRRVLIFMGDVESSLPPSGSAWQQKAIPLMSSKGSGDKVLQTAENGSAIINASYRVPSIRFNASSFVAVESGIGRLTPD